MIDTMPITVAMLAVRSLAIANLCVCTNRSAKNIIFTTKIIPALIAVLCCGVTFRLPAEEGEKASIDIFGNFKDAFSAFEPKLLSFNDSALPLLSNDYNSAYLKAIATLSEHHTQLLRKDAARKCTGNEADFYGKRGLRELEELDEIVSRGGSMIEELKSIKRPNRYGFMPISSAKHILMDGWIMSNPLETKGRNDVVPAIFSGYGHFRSAIADMPLFNATGCNAIQTEIGPSKIVMGEDSDGKFTINTSMIEKTIADILDRAAKNNIAVVFLLSPHYFPEWAIEKHKEIKGDNGCIQYEFNHPYARRLIEAYLKAVIPVLKNSPNAAYIHSLCLSNEPIYKPLLSSTFTRNEFHKYLIGKYGDLASLNQAWGSSFASIDAAIGNSNPVSGKSYDGFYYDFHVFAQDAFSGWHKWMADIIRSEWPTVPLHAKIMIWETINTGGYRTKNIDPEAFSSIMDLNGNDGIFFLQHKGNSGWLQTAMGFALQRSFKKTQIVNSENHIIEDRTLVNLPYDLIYTSIFQQFMHGMGFSATWVWEDWDYKSFLNKHDFVGSIYRRPLSAYALSAASMDAARLGSEIKVFFDDEPEVAIIYSKTSALLDDNYLSNANSLFSSLSCIGRKIGFLSEKQICDGRLGKVRVLFIPECRHLNKRTLGELARYISSGKLTVVCIGNAPNQDEYGKAFDGNLVGAEWIKVSPNKPEVAALAQRLLDSRLGALPLVVSAESPKGLHNVEWKMVRGNEGSYLLSVTNYNSIAMNVRVVPAKGGAIKIDNLISCDKASPVFSLKPLQPQLFRVAK